MKVITIGKKLVAVEQLAFVEPFDLLANPEFRPEENYKGRIVMLNRDIVLTEQTPQEFATEHELHLFTEDMLPSIGPSCSGSRPSNRPRPSSQRSPTRHGSNGGI